MASQVESLSVGYEDHASAGANAAANAIKRVGDEAVITETKVTRASKSGEQLSRSFGDAERLAAKVAAATRQYWMALEDLEKSELGLAEKEKVRANLVAQIEVATQKATTAHDRWLAGLRASEAAVGAQASGMAAATAAAGTWAGALSDIYAVAGSVTTGINGTAKALQAMNADFRAGHASFAEWTAAAKGLEASLRGVSSAQKAINDATGISRQTVNTATIGTLKHAVTGNAAPKGKTLDLVTGGADASAQRLDDLTAAFAEADAALDGYRERLGLVDAAQRRYAAGLAELQATIRRSGIATDDGNQLVAAYVATNNPKAKLAADWEGMLAVEGIAQKERISQTKTQAAAAWEAQLAMDAWGAAEAKAKLAADWEGMLATEGFQQKERIAQTKAMVAANWEAQLAMEQMDAPIKQAKDLEDLKNRVDPAAAALRRLTDDQKALDAARAAGKLNPEEYTAYTAAVARHKTMIEQSTVSQKAMTNAVGLTKSQMQALTPQINDVISGLIMGQPPMMIFAQQSGQIVQALQAGGAELPKFTLGMGLMVGGVAAATLALGAAIYGASQFSAEIRALERTIALTGNAAGVTSDQIVGMSDALADSAHVSKSTAREIQTAYAETGKIGGQMLVSLTEQTRNWALATNQDTGAAARQLAEMFADPAKAVDGLVAKYDLYDAAQVKLIKNYQAQGKMEKAQQVLLDGITPRIADATERVSALAEAWEWASRGVSNFIDSAGRGFAGKGPSLAELKAQADRAAKDYKTDPTGSNWINGAKLSTQEIAESTAQTYGEAFRKAEADSWFAAIKAGDADFRKLQAAVSDFAASVDPASAAIQTYDAHQIALEKAIKAGAVSQAEATRMLGLHKAQLLDTMAPMQAFAAEAERQVRVLDAHAGVARSFEQRRQEELKKRGLKPGAALPQRTEDALYDGVVQVDEAQSRDRVRVLDETAQAQQRLNRAQIAGNPREVAAATTALAIAQRKANGETVTATESQRLYDRAADQASSQIAAQTLQMGLQADAADRAAAAAGKGEAAQRRAAIETAVAAAEIKGLGLETRLFLELQEAAAQAQIHDQFSGAIDQEVDANKRLLAVMGEGVSATRDAEGVNKAWAQTLREIPYPEVGESLEEWNQRLDANIAKLREQRDAADGVDLQRYITQLQDTSKALTFQGTVIGLPEDAKAVAKAEFDALEYSRQRYGEYAKLSPQLQEQTDRAVATAKSTAALSQEIKRQEDAYQAVGSAIDSAIVRPLESVVDALVKGQAETIKLGDLFKGVVASLAGDALKLGIVNPIKNAVGLGQNPSLWDMPAISGSQKTVKNADGSTSFAPSSQGVGGSWINQPAYSWGGKASGKGGENAAAGEIAAGVESVSWGRVLAGIGGVAAGITTATQAGASAGQKIGGGLTAAGGAVMLIPGGVTQVVGGVMMAAGALLAAVTGAKDRGTAYSRSNIVLGSNGKYGLGSYAADNNGDPAKFNADALKVAKGLNDIASRLSLTPKAGASFIDTKEKSAEQAALELLKGMQSAVPEVAYALAHEAAVSLEEALKHLEFAHTFDKQVQSLRSSISDLFEQFQTGVDTANKLGTSLVDFLDNAGTVFAVSSGSKLPGFATGTISAPSGWAIVGEKGPELVRLSGGERIWSAQESAQMLAGMGQGRDDTLIHLRGTDELAAVRRALGTAGRINPVTGLLGFDEGSASGSGGENAAHGETNSSTAGRDSAYGGGWGDSGRGGSGALDTIASAISNLTSTFTDTLAAWAGWQADTAQNTHEQTAAMASMAGISTTAVAATLSAVASEFGPTITGFFEAALGAKGTAPAVDYGYTEMSGASSSGGSLGQAAIASGRGGAYAGVTAADIDNTLAVLSAAIKSDPSISGALVASLRVGGTETNGVIGPTVQQIADTQGAALSMYGGDPAQVLQQLDQAAQQILTATGTIPDVLQRALDGANSMAPSMGLTTATAARQELERQAQASADALQTQFNAVGLTTTRVSQLNDIVVSLANNTFSPIGKDFDQLAIDMKRAATAYTDAGQSVPDGLFGAMKQMESLGAVKKRLLDEVDGVTAETSPEQKKVEQLKGQWSNTATNLVKAFTSVGIVGDELASKLNDGLANAIKKEQKAYSEAAATGLRKAKGEDGYDTADAIGKAYKTALKDIDALWTEGTDKAREMGVAADTMAEGLKGLVKSGGLTSKSLKELQTTYADQPTVLAAVTAALTDLTTAAARQQAKTIRQATNSFETALDPKYRSTISADTLLGDAGITADLGALAGEIDTLGAALTAGTATAAGARAVVAGLTAAYRAETITETEYTAVVQGLGQAWTDMTATLTQAASDATTAMGTLTETVATTAQSVLDAHQKLATAPIEATGKALEAVGGTVTGPLVAFLQAGIDPGERPGLTRDTQAYNGKALAGTLSADDLAGGITRLDTALGHGRLSFEQYGTMVEWTTGRFVDMQEKLLAAANDNESRADKKRQALLGIRDAVGGPGRQAGQMLLDAGVSPVGLEGLTGSLNGFLTAVRGNTATLDDYVGVALAVTGVYDEKKLTEEQYTSVLEDLGTEFQKVSEKTKNAIDGLKTLSTTIGNWLSDLKVGDLSTLDPAQKRAEAEKAFQDALRLANTGDENAISRLTGLADGFLKASQTYYASSAAYGLDYTAVTGALERFKGQIDAGTTGVQTSAKATLSDALLVDLNKEIAQSRTDQIDALGDIKDAQDLLVRGQEAVKTVLADDVTSALKRLSATSENPVSQPIVAAVTGLEKGLLINLQALAANDAPTPTALQTAVYGVASDLKDGGDPNTMLSIGGYAISQARRNAIARALGYDGLFGAGALQTYMAGNADWSTQFLAAVKAAADPGAGIVSGLLGAHRDGGIVGAYEAGGIVGNGVWGRDSVVARYAGGGLIALAGGEGVLTAAATAAIGGAAMVDRINRTGSLPTANDRFPAGVTVFTPPRASADRDGGALLSELRALRSEVKQLRDERSRDARAQITVAAKAGDGTMARLDRVADATETQAGREKLRNAKVA